MRARVNELLVKLRALSDKPALLAVAGPLTLILGIGVVSSAPWRRGADEPAASSAAAAAGEQAVSGREPEAHDDSDPATEDWFNAQDAAPAAVSSEGYECLLEPAAEVAIGSPTIGLIQEIHVDRADVIRAGDVLVQLESSVEVAALEVARARARMAGVVGSKAATAELEQKRLARAEQLYRGKALSLDVRDEVQTQAKVAAQELVQAREEKQLAALEFAQAEANLERRVIRAPISGVVVDRMMNPGEVVDEEKILRIAQIDPLRVEALLPAAMFGSVGLGTRAAVTPEHPGDQVHVARVVRIDRVIDPASGTFAVRMELPNAEHAIASGLHCQVRFLGDDAAPAAPAP
jgi:RND family efflux transporter MFP subunit